MIKSYQYMELYLPQIIILASSLLLIIFGTIEYHLHLKRLKKIPCRILVNGSRGKSSVTRMVASVLHEAGYKVTARVTGTKAVHIFDDGTEKPVKRKNFARITEILGTIKLAVNKDSDAVVIECMALLPEYQKILSEKLVKPDITVITNVRSDHLDVMGPAIINVAEAFSSTINKESKVISSEMEFADFFKTEADKKRAEAVLISRQHYNSAEKEVFSGFTENANLVFALGKTLKIEDDIILNGINKVSNEKWSNFRHKIIVNEKVVSVLNMFSVNDTDSTMKLMQHMNLENNSVIMIFNHRVDRVERALQFCDLFIQCKKEYNIAGIVFIGEGAFPFLRLLKRSGYPSAALINRKRLDDVGLFIKDTVEYFLPGVDDMETPLTIIGVGNIRGTGFDIVNYLNAKGVQSA